MSGITEENKPEPANEVQGQDGRSKPQNQSFAGFDGNKVKNVVIHHTKIVLAALGIWTVGWLGLHYVWVLMGLLIFAIWRMNKKDKDRRMKSLLEVTKNEQKVLAQMKDLPSWVFFPDVERAEWLNEIIVQMWPYVGKMVHKIMKETVEPKMQEKLPGIIKSLYFEEVSLGNQAPKIGGIKVYAKNVLRSEIIIDLDLIYTGDASVKVKVKGVAAGITDIQVRGKVRVEINPLLSSSPLIGGMSFYFLNSPDIDFNLTNLLNILDIPGLSDILHCVIKDVVSSFVVLPNRIKIPIAKNANLEELKYPMPDGVLRIEVIEAEDLMARDINVFSKNSSDPYVILNVGAQTLRTKEHDETLNPKWNETFEVFIESNKGRKLKIQVFDQDLGSHDQNLGSTELSIEKIAKLGTSDTWLPLEGVESGKIHLRCSWFTFSSKASDLSKVDKEDQLATAALFVKLDSASHLPVTNEDDETSSPFCTVTVGNQIDISKKLDQTSKPVWEEMFQFLIRDPRYQELNIQIMDHKTDADLGKLDFVVDRLLKNREMRFKQPFNLKGATDDSTLSMIVELRALVCSPAMKEQKAEIKKGLAKGEIELTIKLDEEKKVLLVNVHKARDLLPENESDALNTKVQMYLLPDTSDAGMKETTFVKEKDPKYQQDFEYRFDNMKELKEKTLKIAVINNQESKDCAIGQVLIKLQDYDPSKGQKKWYSLKA